MKALNSLELNLKNFYIKNRKNIQRSFFALTILLIISKVTLARAGGAGGSSSRSRSSSNGRSGDLEIFIWLFMILPWPARIILIVGGGLYFYYWGKTKKYRKSTGYFKEVRSPQRPSNNGVVKIKQNNPDFSEEKFLNNVKKAFFEIQKAWEHKDLSQVRRYISDGLWQSYNTQFIMMDLLDQKNILTDIKIKNMFVDRCEQDGLFDIIHVAITVSLTDRFFSGLDSRLNSGGHETFTEYWSFIKKRGIKSKDIYHNEEACPACGGNIKDKLGETANCPYCNTLINNGTHDWILSEVTQQEDYITVDKISSMKKSHKHRQELIKENPDFSVQKIEGQVGNGFLQIIGAKALKKPERIHRFVSEDLFKTLKKEISQNEYIYNRLYLNSINLIGAEEIGDYNRLYLEIFYSYQRVKLDNKKVEIIDPMIIKSRQIICIKRKIQFKSTKGQLYMHQCSSCGANITNSMEVRCEYCGSLLGNPEYEWIFEKLMNFREYTEYFNKKNFKQKSAEKKFALNEKELENLMSIKEYAMNNIMIIIASDGVFSDEEKEFVEVVSKRLKFRKKEREGIIRKAKQNRLEFMMPESIKAKKDVYKLMEKASMADGKLHEMEKKILEYTKKIIQKESTNFN